MKQKIEYYVIKDTPITESLKRIESSKNVFNESDKLFEEWKSKFKKALESGDIRCSKAICEAMFAQGYKENLEEGQGYEILSRRNDDIILKRGTKFANRGDDINNVRNIKVVTSMPRLTMEDGWIITYRGNNGLGNEVKAPIKDLYGCIVLKEGKDAQKVIDRITRAKLKGLDEVATDALESGYIEKKLDELYGWQLAALWSMCMLSEENDYSGQPYDDEVYDAISKRRDSENIFELANEIYAKFFKKSKNESLKESVSIDDELVEGIYYILKKGVTQYGEDFDFEHNDRDYNCWIETSSYDKTWMDITIVDVEENEIVMVETYPAPPYNDNTDEELWNASMDIAERVYNELDSLTESIGGFLKYRNWLRKNGKKDNEESYYGYLQDTDSAFKSMPERDRRTQVQNMFSHRYMNPVTEGNEIKRKIKEYPRGSVVPQYLWTAVCNGKYDKVKNYFESGKEVNKRYPRFGGESSLIMGALRNGDMKMVELLKSFGETIIDDEKKEYDTIMKRLSK